MKQLYRLTLNPILGRVSLGLSGLGLSLLSFGLSLGLSACDRSLPTSLNLGNLGALPMEPSVLILQKLKTPKAQVYLLKIPANSGYRVMVQGDRQGVKSVVDFAQTTIAQGPTETVRPLAVINGGYFDPKNRQTTAYVTVNGQMLLDPRVNGDLMANANIAPYLSRVLNRSEFRRYQCGLAGGGLAGGGLAGGGGAEETVSDRYDITARGTPTPPGCTLIDALGAGPQLLPTMTDAAEAFYIAKDGQIVRDPLGRDRPNARSAIALLMDGTILWILVAQKPGVANSGMSLGELAEFLQGQGAVKAMNLDGGTSSSLWYGGTSYFGKFDEQGRAIQRPVKSVLTVVRLGHDFP